MAYHTPLVSAAQNVFRSTLADALAGSACPKVPFYSTVTNTWKEEPFTPAYCWKNIEKAVLFAPSITRLQQHFNTSSVTYIEICAHPVLKRSLIQCGVAQDPVLSSMSRLETDEMRVIQNSAAKLFQNGANSIRFGQRAQINPILSRIAPSYPYQKKEYWVESQQAMRMNRGFGQTYKPFVTLNKGTGTTEPVLVSTDAMPWTKDHVIQGKMLFPGAGFLESFLELENVRNLYDVEFKRPFFVSSEPVFAQVVQESNLCHFQSREHQDADWEINCVARYSHQGSSTPPEPLQLTSLLSTHVESQDGRSYYKQIATDGYEYGPKFQCIQSIRKTPCGKTCLNKIHLDSESFSDRVLQSYMFHPAALDAAVHGTFAVSRRPKRLLLPVGVKHLWYHPDFDATPRDIWVHVDVSESSITSASVNLSCFDADTGTLFCQLIGFQVDLVQTVPRPPQEHILEWIRVASNSFSTIEPKVETPVHVFEWKVGKTEMELIELCQKLPDDQMIDVWIHTTDKNPEEYMAFGIGRTLANEHRQCRVTLVEFQYGMDSKLKQDWLTKLFVMNPEELESEIRITRGGQMYFQYLQLYDIYDQIQQDTKRAKVFTSPEMEVNDEDTDTDSEKDFDLSSRFRLVSKTLEIKPDCCQKLESDQVEIEMIHVALTSNDLELWQKNDQRLGFEGTGYVTKVGSKIVSLAVGDKVLCCTPHGRSMASHVFAHENQCFRLPETNEIDWSGTYHVFGTAWSGLVTKGCINAQDTVLIQDAESPVGQAAIQICRFFKCQIIATVQSFEQKVFLQSVYGLDHVYLSQNLQQDQWVEQILKNIGGVDLVWNPISIQQAISCLRYGGRVVVLIDPIQEVHGLLKDMTLKNATLIMVNLNQSDLVQLQRNKHYGLFDKFKQMYELLSNGSLEPLSSEKFPLNQASIAFSTPKKNISIEIVSNPKVLATTLNDNVIFPTKTYLLVGGTGGFGLEIALWLVMKGARHVVLTSRSGISTLEQHQKINWMKQQNVSVCIIQGDASDPSMLPELFSKFGSIYPILGGVFVLTMVLRDGALNRQTKENFNTVYRAKVSVAKNVVAALPSSLGYPDFVLFATSISGVFGNPGQSNYASGNCFVSALAKTVQNGASIAFPAINDIGVVTGPNGATIMGQIEAQGLKCTESFHLCQSIERVLVGISTGLKTIPEILPARMDYLVASEMLPSCVSLTKRIIDELQLKTTVDCNGEAEGDQLSSLKQLIARSLGVDKSEIQDTESLTSYGMDSLTSTNVAFQLKSRFQLNVAQQEFLTGITMAQIIDRLN